MSAVVLSGAACEPREATGPVTTPSFASSSLPHTNNTNVPIPVTINADLAACDCSNNTGPQITFSGATLLGGFGVELTFSNNVKGTHVRTVDATAELITLPTGAEIVIPKQPVQGGVGGNPYIWIQFTDADGEPVSEEIYVGRCVQGAGWHVTESTTTRGSAWAEYSVQACENSTGPYITYEGGLSLAGLNANIIFRNADNKVGGPHKATASSVTEVGVIEPGLSFTFPKQPVLGGVGGNPWIFAGFTDGEGNLLDELTLLGRCEQLSKAL
jgi:hypothetical protein